jgi:response regulator of citrate/malate metabolism
MVQRLPDKPPGTLRLLPNLEAACILMVEDNPDHAHLARTALEDYGFWLIDSAGTMAEAFQMMRSHHYQVLLVDYCLPDGYGLDLLDWVDERCTVVMMTAQGSEKVATEAFKRGALDYVVKDSLFREVLPEIVEQAMAKNEAIKKASLKSDGESETSLKSAIASSSSLPLLNGYIHTDHLTSTLSKIRRHLAEVRSCLRIVRFNPEEPVTENQLGFLEAALESCEMLEKLVTGVVLGKKEKPET